MELVNIVLATYKPNIVYFCKLLESLNEQTYPNIKIIVRDDSGDDTVFLQISELIKDKIKNFEYIIFKNSKNLGSNKTFELLTQDAQDSYIAYCDQDDIWEKEKIDKLVKNIKKENAVLCYSDLLIIDKNDKVVAKSFKDINKRLNHKYGEGLFKYFLRRNSVTGCTMLIKTCIAQKAIPFCNEYYVHDHWLTLFASTQGKIAYVDEPLIRYRIHENNQIGVNILKNINNKEDYLIKKLLIEKEKYDFLLKKYEFNEYQKKQIYELSNWTQKRIDFFKKKNFINIIEMIKYINIDWQLVVFEMFINLAPKRSVEKLFKIIKSNKICG